MSDNRSANQHTPGPWSFHARLSGSENHRGWNVIAPGRDLPIWICEVSPYIKDFNGDPSAEGEANVRLIAAAPELLALAKRYASECGDCLGHGQVQIATDCIAGEVYPVTEPCKACADVRALIAKAEGC